ncbi:MAG: alpha/beta fold hydrolase [Polyangiaceae bacterium]|nr:alpha/beta fold hydrolase [Polyangiaceae bacterium]
MTRPAQTAAHYPWAALWVALLMLMPWTVGCLSFHRGPMPGEPRGSYLQLQGARVRYTDSAEATPGDRQKPAAVLIHGFAASLDTWVEVAPALTSSHRVVTLDLKGFGWSDRPEGDYSPDAQARLVFGLMDHLGIEKATWVAHSWGSSVALSGAISQPDRVQKLALYDAWVYEEQLPVFFQWARASGIGESMFAAFYKERTEDRMLLAFFDKKRVSEELVDAVNAALDRPGTVAAALAAVRGQRFAEMQSRYKSVTQKTLLLWGREDLVTTQSYGERLSRDLPNAKLIMYPRCGHFPMIEAKEASTRDLVEFLKDDAKPEPVSTVQKSAKAEP